MKIINSVVVFMILVCGSQLSHGKKLKCEFIDGRYDLFGELYTCYVPSLFSYNTHNNLTIDGYSGVHKQNKNDADVKAIWIRDTNTKYIPTNLGSFSNLTALIILDTQLVEIKYKDFNGMQDLEEIRIINSKLSSVPLDAFATLTKLRFINLGLNEIEELPNGIFKNNLEMEEIHLNGNRIKYLGTEIFKSLNKLHYVDLGWNICVDTNYNGTTQINQLKKDIKMNCKNPNEVPTTTTTITTQFTTTTTTTQNPMEEKLIELEEKTTKLEKKLREAKAIQAINEFEAKKASNGEKLNCKFKDVGYGLVGLVYSCEVTSLVNPYNNVTIDGYSGKHEANKNDADVKGIYIHDTNTKYIPTNLGSFSNLTVLHIGNTQLVEIKAKDFHGMQDLEEISLSDNKLSSVPLDVFASLTKLRIISLSENQIEELPNGICEKNLELEKMYLSDNKIKYLGTEIFNDLKKLNYVDLEGNICVDDEYKGTTEIFQLKNEIKIKCRNPNENPATTTTTTSTTQTPTRTPKTQNPMEENFIEMQEKITKLENELKEAKEDIDVLKKELREAKENQQTNEDELKKKLEVAKELLQKNEDALKKELWKPKEIKQTNESEAKKANGEKLNCEFEEVKYEFVGLVYSCFITSLDNPHNNLTIDGYSGEHKQNKNDADVKGILNRGTSTKYIPTNLGSLFDLTALSMENTQLVEIKAKDFHGMQNLKSINLNYNKLSSVPLDVFTTLTKLRFIDLDYNQIEELPNGIFKNNLGLEEIHLYGNKVKYLGTEIFNDPKKLNYVDLRNNICVDDDFNEALRIIQLKDVIKLNCFKPKAIEN